MESTARSLDSEHPLFDDRDLFDKVRAVMYAVIQKTLHKGLTASRQGTGPDRAMIGGVSAEDILQDALINLLEYAPEKLTSSWGAMGVTIAKRRAVDAVRVATKGLRGTDHRPEIKVESGDAPTVGADGEAGPTRWDLHPVERLNPEEEYEIMQRVLDLRDLAREELTERDQVIFFGIRFQGHSRKELGEELNLTAQRIGQIYNKACCTLENHPRYPMTPDRDSTIQGDPPQS